MSSLLEQYAPAVRIQRLTVRVYTTFHRRDSEGENVAKLEVTEGSEAYTRC